MNKYIKIFSVILLFIFSLNNSSATFFHASTSKKTETKNIIKNKKQVSEITIRLNNVDKTPVNLWEIIASFASYYDWKIPESYKYIKVNIVWVNPNSEFYKNIQKLIYVNILPNKKFSLNEKYKVSAYSLYRLAEKLFKTKLISSWNIKYLKWRKANVNDLKYLKKVLNKKIIPQPLAAPFNTKESNVLKLQSKNNSELYIQKQKIFNDVYKTIKTQHYDKDKISDIDLIEWATKGLAEATGDKFTTYFPPVDNKNFQESLNSEFEWIGAYVEMEKPWILKIVSPIPGSPSEKAGLKWWDTVLEADWKKITKETSLQEAVSWIKGPKGTTVELTILRDWKILKIKVIRDKIVIKEVEYKKLDNKTFYIKMTIFGANISSEFKEALEALKKEKWIKKVIFDLRNNWGWYLDQVSDMLWYFVPKWEATAVVKYRKWEQDYYSKGYDLIDFSKYKIVILQNGWTASASEIFIWTIKDYFPKATIIWEQSYWKGSVQTIKNYIDGSSFKYTVAHWFTGKTQTGINWIWITPDIKLEFDFDRYKKYKKDNQLERAKTLR